MIHKKKTVSVETTKNEKWRNEFDRKTVTNRIDKRWKQTENNVIVGWIRYLHYIRTGNLAFLAINCLIRWSKS